MMELELSIDNYDFNMPFIKKIYEKLRNAQLCGGVANSEKARFDLQIDGALAESIEQDIANGKTKIRLCFDHIAYDDNEYQEENVTPSEQTVEEEPKDIWPQFPKEDDFGGIVW